MSRSLYSAPGEEYQRHVSLCKEKLKVLFPVFLPVLKRTLQWINEPKLFEAMEMMVLYHDLGKLTRKWQEGLGRRLPSHSTIGAAYLFKTIPEGLREPVSFSVAIHHTDRGLLGDNIERPDVQAILEGVVKNDGKVEWDEGVEGLPEDLFPKDVKGMTVYDLKDMARGLRLWARGGSFLEQHQRRLQSMLCHHILKLCDISSAVERKEYQREDERDYYGGWLMVEEIRRYVNNISWRQRC